MLKGVTLPARLGAAGAPGVLLTKSGLILGGGGDSALYAFDASTGKELWTMALPRRTTATPMTYRTRADTQFVVIATGSGSDATLVALSVRGEHEIARRFTLGVKRLAIGISAGC